MSKTTLLIIGLASTGTPWHVDRTAAINIAIAWLNVVRIDDELGWRCLYCQLL
jgi:hypothetical protein